MRGVQGYIIYSVGCNKEWFECKGEVDSEEQANGDENGCQVPVVWFEQMRNGVWRAWVR